MTKTSLRASALASALLAGTALTTTPACGQSSPLPTRSAVDSRGVDAISGTWMLRQSDLSIGPADAGGLSYETLETGEGAYSHNFNLTLSLPLATVAKITLEDRSIGFTKSAGVWSPDLKNGWTLVETSSAFVLTDASGVIYNYDKATAAGNPSYSFDYAYYDNGAVNAVATSITKPNGIVITLTYQRASWAWIPGGIASYAVRLTSVTSNAGYQLSYHHPATSLASNGSNLGAWWGIDKVTAVNGSVDYCDPGSNACTPSSAARYVAYDTGTAPDGVTPTSRVSDAKGLLRQTYTEFPAAGSIFHIRRPSGAETVYTVDENNFVTNVSDGVGNWTYEWYSDGDYLTGTQTDPLGHQNTTYAYTTGSQLRSHADGLGHQTTYEYDVNGRLTKVIAPEGNYAQYTYDSRGNITQTTIMPKAGSGLTPIVTSAVFPSSCTSSAICNKPTSTTDARGAVTNYSYNATTGLLTQIDLPAATIGAVRPQTRYGYSALYAYVKNASGGTVASPSPIYKLTSASACATGSSCVGTADEALTTYAYGTSGVANNLLPTGVTVAAGNGGVSASTATTYDYSGEVTSVDGPLAGSADTQTTLRDSRGLVTEVLSPDPDGSGPLKNRAFAYGYNSDDQVTTVSRGTTNPDGSGFSALETKTTGYDSRGQKTQTSLASGGTTYLVTQYSYDAAGRPDCTAVRMNPAAFGSLPSACTLSSTGNYGADRITRTGYDAADRPTSVTVAYGTADQATDVATTYTNNDKVQSVTDAEGNKTSYLYDGFDRLSLTLHPSSTKGAGTSNSSDYEQLGYDANGNVTSRRLRDGNSIGYTFDALSRLTFKDLPGTDPDVTYAYDLLDRMISTATSSQTLSFTYDALGRNLTQVGPLGTVTSTWDTGGRRTRITHPDSFYVDQDYLVTGELAHIRENGATSGVGLLATYAYDDLGRRTTLTRGDGSATSYAYDNISRLTQLAEDLSGTSYDQTLGFSYNPASQIIQNTRSNDAYAWTGHYNVNRGYTANGLNQYTASGSVTPTYDTKGNLTSVGSQAYTYSSENLLTSASGGVTLSYDPAMRLYQTAGGTPGTTRFQYDGTAIIAEYNSSNSLQRRFVHGSGTDEPLVWYEGSGTTDRRFLHTDERGSVVAVGSSAGTSVNTYDEYGIPLASNVGRFQYTGQTWLPELGMYYYKARIYSPTWGRFLQTDPIGYGAGMNHYAYAGNDPVNARDPSGLQQAYRGRDGIVFSTWPAVETGFNTGSDMMATWPDGGDLWNRDLNMEGAALHKAAGRAPQRPQCPPWSGQRTPAPTNGPGEYDFALRYPEIASGVYELSRDAIAATAIRYPGQGHTNNEADAYRHFFWSFSLTQNFGADMAEAVGTAHEQQPDTAAGHYMDFYNNAVARWAAQDPAYKNMTPDQAARTAIRLGCLVTHAGN